MRVVTPHAGEDRNVRRFSLSSWPSRDDDNDDDHDHDSYINMYIFYLCPTMP